MREHGDGDDDADRMRGLEAEADGAAVEKAVHAQHRRPDAAARRRIAGMRIRRAMEQQQSVEPQIQEEPERGPADHGRRGGMSGAQVERLGQQIEERDADDRAGAESEDQVQLVVQFQCEQPSGEGAREGRKGDDGE